MQRNHVCRPFKFPILSFFVHMFIRNFRLASINKSRVGKKLPLPSESSKSKGDDYIPAIQRLLNFYWPPARDHRRRSTKRFHVTVWFYVIEISARGHVRTYTRRPIHTYTHTHAHNRQFPQTKEVSKCLTFSPLGVTTWMGALRAVKHYSRDWHMLLLRRWRRLHSSCEMSISPTIDLRGSSSMLAEQSMWQRTESKILSCRSRLIGHSYARNHSTHKIMVFEVLLPMDNPYVSLY